MSNIETMLQQGRIKRLTYGEDSLQIIEKTNPEPVYEVTLQLIDKKLKKEKRKSVVKEFKATVPASALPDVYIQLMSFMEDVTEDSIWGKPSSRLTLAIRAARKSFQESQ